MRIVNAVTGVAMGFMAWHVVHPTQVPREGDRCGPRARLVVAGEDPAVQTDLSCEITGRVTALFDRDIGQVESHIAAPTTHHA